MLYNDMSPSTCNAATKSVLVLVAQMVMKTRLAKVTMVLLRILQQQLFHCSLRSGGDAWKVELPLPTERVRQLSHGFTGRSAKHSLRASYSCQCLNLNPEGWSWDIGVTALGIEMTEQLTHRGVVGGSYEVVFEWY